MRLDHIAYRVADKQKTAKFFMEAFGYKLQQEFEITLSGGSKASCIALQPPEKTIQGAPWQQYDPVLVGHHFDTMAYHLAPEIFVSDGPPGSLIGNWVANRDDIGGVHHLAYMVDDVELVMDQWKEKGYAEFLSKKPLHCEKDDPELRQVFTKPSELTGVIYEFIKRGEYGFCKSNVASLMDSTKNCK
jgi:catechol 2,3-dioxygenase-like lactoylglutathione lyase family enzyme